MRHKILIFFLCIITLPLTAREKPYDKKQFTKAYMRCNEVMGSGDTLALRHIADSLREAGKRTNNYRVEFLYYEAQSIYLYYAGHSTEERIALYEQAMEEAKEIGSPFLYWQYYYTKCLNWIYVSTTGSLEVAEQMLQEARDEHSVYGMMKSYYALGYIHAYRRENRVAVEVMEEAAKLGEDNKGKNEEVALMLVDIYNQLANYSLVVPDYDKALRYAKQVEDLVQDNPALETTERERYQMGVNAMRAMVYFESQQYDRFGEQLKIMKQSPDYNAFVSSFSNVQLYFYILLYEKRDSEAREFLKELSEDEVHNFNMYYHIYHGNYKQAMQEHILDIKVQDSINALTHNEDMAAMGAKMGNATLQLEKTQLQNRQRMIVMGAIGGILLIIVISISILLVRHRRHARQLQEKNEQLQVARDEAVQQRAVAEEQREEAETQRSIAEEQRAEAEAQRLEAETQRNIAEEQRAEAETQRGIAEEQRAEAEAQRAEAETQRGIAEEQREEAEAQRAEAETQRSIAEEQRSIAEEQREEAESQRAEAETQRGIAEEQRLIAEKARKVAERANEMKGEFILSMMHEIRTPLNHIKGFSAIIADPNMHGETEMMQEASNQISQSTRHLTHLLDDILQLGNYDGMAEVEKSDVSVMEMLLTAMMNSPQSDPSKVEMTPAIDDLDPSLTIKTNMDMGQKAFAALINNAVKFTKEGHIKLGVETDDEQVVRLYVEDTGPGIPAGQEERIFERFVKLDEFVPGTGLGLSLSDAICKVLGGRVYVDTNYPGPGARFVMELPRKEG